MAKECGICIVPGTIVEGYPGEEDEEGRLLNVAYFIGKEGEVKGKYVKKNLWWVLLPIYSTPSYTPCHAPVFIPSWCFFFFFLPFPPSHSQFHQTNPQPLKSLKLTPPPPRGPERAHLTSSTHAPHEVISTPIGKVGLLICWDLAFPEAFRELIAAGAQIIIIPTFWTLNDCNAAGLARNPASEALFLDSMLTARAFENTCAVVFANAGGPPGKGYAGLSQVRIWGT